MVSGAGTNSLRLSVGFMPVCQSLGTFLHLWLNRGSCHKKHFVKK